MKNIVLSLVLFFGVSAILAQPPQAFKYQAVVRDASGEIVSNQVVGVRISIRNNDISGPINYQETHSLTTNEFGLITLNIGMGTPVGSYDFQTIIWEHYSKFLEVEVDPLGGINYTSMGTTELVSVPYALFSGSSADGYWDKSNDEIFYSGGNVGIGTTDPLSTLHVYGGGLFRADGSGVSLSGGTDYGVIRYSEPSGFTTNIKLKWAQTTFSGKVGINQQDPAYSLHVVNSTSDNWLAGFHNTSTSATGHGVVIRADGGDPLWVQNSYSTMFSIKNNGNVGIGTADPDNRLVIKSSGAGDVMKILSNTNNTLAKFRHTGNNSGALYLYDGSNNNTVFFYGEGNSFINSGSLGLGTSIPSNSKLQIEGTGTYDAMLRLNNVGTDGASFFMGSTNSAWGGGTNSDRFVMGYGAPASDNIDLTINYGGDVGIGTTHPVTKLEVSADGGVAVYGHSNGNAGVWGQSVSSYGVFGQSTSSWAGYFSGSVYVTGTLGKGAGSFIIDHPLDPENKLLRHNFVESPENLLIYRGKVKLNENGEATVDLPNYFKALTKEDGASIQLTPVGRPFLTGAEWNSDYSAIIIYGDNNREVFWEVLADRDDPVIHELGRPVEEEKGGENTLCEKGKLLYPKAYGFPESAGRDYEMIKNSN